MHVQFLRNLNQVNPDLAEFISSLDADFFFDLCTTPISVACFLLTAYSLYSMAKARELPKPWLAWVPFGNSWILGYLADQYQGRVHQKMVTKRIFLVILQIVFAALILLFLDLPSGPRDGVSQYIAVRSAILWLVIILVVGIVRSVVIYITLYDVYRSCTPKWAKLYLVLSILIPGVAQAILLFVCRNKDYGMEPPLPGDNEEP